MRSANPKTISKGLLCIVLLCSLLFVGCSEGREAPEQNPDIYLSDGLYQHRLHYLKDVYYADGVIYYTIVNDSDKTSGYGDGPDAVQRKVDGEWKYVETWIERTDLYHGLPAHASHEVRHTVKPVRNLPSGEYRVILGTVMHFFDEETQEPFVRFTNDAQAWYKVGYFTIE